MLHLAAAPVLADKKPHPAKVNLFGAQAVVRLPDALAQLIEQAG